MTSYVDLIGIVALDTFDRLPQRPRPSMQVIRMLIAMFVKDDAGILSRITYTMQISVMPGIL